MYFQFATSETKWEYHGDATESYDERSWAMRWNVLTSRVIIFCCVESAETKFEINFRAPGMRPRVNKMKLEMSACNICM
jgi:hypothetical protein